MRIIKRISGVTGLVNFRSGLVLQPAFAEQTDQLDHRMTQLQIHEAMGMMQSELMPSMNKQLHRHKGYIGVNQSTTDAWNYANHFDVM